MSAPIEVGEELPELRRVVTREDVRAYAEAGGDRNPLHVDDEVARSAGFDGVIAHGMFTMGHMAACVEMWAAGPGSFVERVSAQFRAPVAMGDEIIAGGRVRAVDGDRVTLDLWVRVDGGEGAAAGGGAGAGAGGGDRWPIKRGEAVVRLP